MDHNGNDGDRVMNILKHTLGPHLVKAYRQRYGAESYLDEIRRAFPQHTNGHQVPSQAFENETRLLEEVDTRGWLELMENDWKKSVFSAASGSDKTRDKLARSIVIQLSIYANDWAHQRLKNLMRFVDTAACLMEIIGEHEAAEELKSIARRHHRNGHDKTAEMVEDTQAVNTYAGHGYMLEVVLNDGTACSYRLEKPRTVVGRSATAADIALTDPKVSRVHLQIIKAETPAVLVTDLHSANGTLLDGKPVKPNQSAHWSVGQIIEIGGTWLILRHDTT